MPNPVDSIAKAITEGFKLIRHLRETAQVRSMRKAIEAAEKYIQVNEGEGEFDYDMEENRKKSRLRHYKKRFFKYNN